MLAFEVWDFPSIEPGSPARGFAAGHPLTIPDLVNGRAFLIEFIRLSVIMVILVGISGG